jgi:glutamine synthetase
MSRSPNSRAITRLLLKRAVKAVAKRHGLGASFMAKPFADCAGCSLHVHVSVVDASGATCSQARAATDLLGRAASRGRRARGRDAGIDGIFAPTAKSYRRYRPGSSCR